MYMDTSRIDRATASPLNTSALIYEDPAQPDDPRDAVVVTTKRGLCRLAMLATEVAGRFEREGSPHDPMSWLLAPLAIFGGGAALDNCLSHDDFMRATLLHGLSLGLDADPAAIDVLLSDDDDLPADYQSDGRGPDLRDRKVGVAAEAALPEPFAGLLPGPFLFTASLTFDDGNTVLHAFHASIASEASVVADRLAVRYGRIIASRAKIAIGVGQPGPDGLDLVSPSLAKVLKLIESAPESNYASGLDINLEQRFDS